MAINGLATSYNTTLMNMLRAISHIQYGTKLTIHFNHALTVKKQSSELVQTCVATGGPPTVGMSVTAWFIILLFTTSMGLVAAVPRRPAMKLALMATNNTQHKYKIIITGDFQVGCSRYQYKPTFEWEEPQQHTYATKHSWGILTLETLYMYISLAVIV